MFAVNASAASRKTSPFLLILVALLVLIAIAWLAGLFDPWFHRGNAPAGGEPFAAGPAVCTQPAPMPAAGFDYPQAEGAVQVWVGNRDEARAREHGWYLWAGLNSLMQGSPVWRSWCTSTQAFAPPPPSGGTGAALDASQVRRHGSINALRIADSLAAGAGGGAEPINLPDAPQYPVPQSVRTAYPQCYNAQSASLDDGPTYQNNGDIMIAGVIYNQAAYQWIRSQHLYLGSALAPMVPPATGTAQMPSMPPGSIVLKPMMWPVPASGYAALPVWDNQGVDGGAYAGFENQGKWPRAVAVTASPQPGVTKVDVTYLYGVKDHALPLGPNTYRQAPVARVGDFYAFRPNLAGMDPCDHALLDASAWWAYNRAFQQGDYLIVVAMHILTKEQPAWTFQSVWWHDRPDQGVFAANRPNIPGKLALGPWRHYLLTSTYGIPAMPKGPTWPVAYNPYIELAAGHPIRTNCMNCHHRAAWPGFQNPPPPWPTGSYLAKGGPGALDVYALDNKIFNGLLGVDSMWAISDRVPVPANYHPPAGGGTAPKAR
jgi:hypothetical protein